MRSAALLLGLVLLPAAARAQASITGVVRDSSGAVLPGVAVEASSPALIERVRRVVTDGNGYYRILDLRPGTYTVTFSLSAFRVTRREGVELIGSFATTVNAEMTVGSVQETVTVTDDAPSVDVRNTSRSQVTPSEVVEALPAARSQYIIAALLPGTTRPFGGQDVGATQTMQLTSFSIHGSRAFDQRLMIDGLTTRDLLTSGWSSNFVPDMGTAAEVVLQYSSGMADATSGGLVINVIPKEGGNRFSGLVFATGATKSFQGNNYSDELRDAGLSTPNELKRVYDINPAVGGPILRDRLWFYGSMRWQESSSYQAGAFENKHGGDLSKWTYEPDTSRPGEGRLTINPSASLRFTWQATPRNKIAVSSEAQNRHWVLGLPANYAPEVYADWDFKHQSFITASWQSPVTNRLLLDAKFANHAEGFADKYPAPDDPYRRAIPVLEQSTGLLYRGKGYCCSPFFFGTEDAPHIMQAQASASYVTGSHTVRVGFQNDFGTSKQELFDNEYGLFYTFNNGVPIALEQHALPLATKWNLSSDLGIYAQDQWTFRRATVNAGVRFHYLKTHFPEQRLGPAYLIPGRHLVIPETDYANMKDITPRVGVAYDLFGDGKTSVKSSWGKYLLTADPRVGNPIQNLAYIARRSWTPSLPLGHPDYYTPQCDLLNPTINGDCGALDNQLWGELVPSAAVNPRTYSGWERREWNQEFSASIQHEIAPRLAVDFGYFRRWYGNFRVVDNRAVTASDFTRYSITAPTDPRLELSGRTIGSLFEVNRNKAGQVDNYTTLASDFGKQIEHWNGFDLTVNARPRDGVLLQGGLSTGRTSTDTCDLVEKLPETTLTAGIIAVPDSYCHVDATFRTQVKLMGTYLVPRIDVQLAATFQATPGPEVLAQYFVTSAQTEPHLDLTGGFRLVNVVPPGTEYLPHLKQLDIRLAKIIRVGRTRTTVHLDIANALNANNVQVTNVTYGPRWLQPLGIMDPRLFKIGAQFEF
jgi:Carboxypeptidase regulatory-like domain